MIPAAESAQLRRRHDDLLVQVDRVPDQVSPGNTTVVGITTTITTYPTTTMMYVGVIPITPCCGTEAEGAAPTLTTGTGTFLAACLLATLPAVGSYVLCTLIDGRWVIA